MALDTLLLEDGSALLLEDGGRLLLESATAEETSAPPGGTFRRWAPTWARLATRHPDTWQRTVTRLLPTWDRVWRYTTMGLPTEGDEIIAAVSDDREYGWDLRHAPELRRGTGITIASGSILGGTGLTIGAVQVLDAEFDGVPAGKGVKVRISGGEAGTVYSFGFLVTLSNGSKIEVPVRLSKVADYEV